MRHKKGTVRSVMVSERYACSLRSAEGAEKCPFEIVHIRHLATGHTTFYISRVLWPFTQSTSSSYEGLSVSGVSGY